MKQGWRFRQMVAVIGILSLSIFAWGCGQSAPTAVDLHDGQSYQTQGVIDPPTDGEHNEWN